MANNRFPATVMVTGAAGNLGRQLVDHLVGLPWCRTVFCVDVAPMEGAPFDSPKAESLVADLADPQARLWQQAAETADAIAHFAARDASPHSTAEDAALATDITANLLAHTNPDGCRFLFASSNHVMGGYKERDWSALSLSGGMRPLPGTRFFANGGYGSSVIYGTSKLVGERLLRAGAFATNGRLSGVALRIGWCLQGEDEPAHIEAAGSGRVAVPGGLVQPPEERARDLTWFRNMWLSHRDFCAEFEAALTADSANWPAPAVVVNAVSANRTTLWDMADARRWLNHVPQDDVWTALGIDPPAAT